MNKFSWVIQSLKNWEECINLDKHIYFESIYEEILKFLDNYSKYKFRTVPWVMNQVILYKDNNIEIRIHDFLDDSSDTYVHNHKNPFVSLCLDWWYSENIYKIIDMEWKSVFKFIREWWGKITFSEELYNSELVYNKDLIIHNPIIPIRESNSQEIFRLLDRTKKSIDALIY